MDPGSLLRSHRRRRRLSQLELAHGAGISARHLSFIETGRSRPGRAVIAALARAMALPRIETNRLCRALGESPLHPESGLDDAAARPLRLALERMLAAHMPWPAVVMDHAWRPVRANAAFESMLARLIRHTRSEPADGGLMDWLFAPDGLQPLIANWSEVAPFLMRRVRHEALIHSDLDDLVQRMEVAIRATGREEGPTEEQGVVLPLELSLGGRPVRLFSLLAGFGSALDAGLEELRIESFCPVDAASEEWLNNLVEAVG